MSALPSPDRQSCSTIVSLEFLYGIWAALLPRETKTSARQDKDLLILTVSFSLVASFRVPVRSNRSDPAKSQSRRPPLKKVTPSLCFATMSNMKSAWLLLLCSFIAVHAVMRDLEALSRRPSNCFMPPLKS
jgi:hypothetical protein